MTQRDRGRRQGGRRRKQRIIDDNIDRQILVLHRAMMAKLALQPALLDGVRETLEQRLASGHPAFVSLRAWSFILEGSRNIQELTEAVLEDSAYKRKLRRHTPFVGLLTEHERQQALDEDAAGHLPGVVFES